MSCPQIRSLIGLPLVVSLLSGAASPTAADEVLVIAPWVWQGFQEYKNQQPPKAFAVSADGLVYGYSYCPDRRCRPTPDARTIALDSCVQNGGRACRIFAVGTDIKLRYEIAKLAPDQVPNAVPAAAPATECGSKSEADCTAIIADYDSRRRAIEVKWATKITQINQQQCGGVRRTRLSCKDALSEAEADRDAELAMLNEEFLKAMAE